jgi:hypothetical protein
MSAAQLDAPALAPVPDASSLPRGAALPRWLGPGAVAFAVIWLVLMAGGRAGMMRDPGTFWHTTTGEIILKEGFIRHDPYTFTFAGTWWVPYQWLGEVAMALAHRAAGFDAQLLGAVTILAGAFAFLAVRLLNTGLHPIAVAALLMVGLAAAGSHFHVRPHVFTLAALAVTAALLADCDLGRQPLRRLVWLLPLFVVWTNIHGGMLGGFGTVVIAIVGWIVFWRLGLPSPVKSWRNTLLLVLLAVACGLTALVNPYGTDLVKTWRIIMGAPELTQIIKEHRPLDVIEPYAWPVLGLAAIYIFVLSGVKPRDVRVTWLLPLVWLFQSFERCRHVALFVVVTLIAIAAMWQSTRWALWLAKNRPDFYEPDAPPIQRPWWANVWLPALLVIASFALEIARVPLPVVGAGWARHSANHWPVEVLDVLKSNEPKPGEPNHLFNDYVDGGFVIYHAPGYRVFVDDRCEVFGGPWLVDFVKAAQKDTATAMQNWQARYGPFHFALTRTGTGFDDYFQTAPEWECVKRGEKAAFYRRKIQPQSHGDHKES